MLIMKTAKTRQAYEAPETSVDFIEMEQCFLQGTMDTGQMQDMNWNRLTDEDDFDIDY